VGSFLKTEVLGYLGKDPEVTFSASGSALCRFSVGVTQKDMDGESTQWVQVAAFGKTGENCGQYLKKGSQVLVHGRLKVSTNEKNGTTYVNVDVAANEVTFLGSADDGAARNPRTSRTESPAKSNGSPPPMSDDDIPF